MKTLKFVSTFGIAAFFMVIFSHNLAAEAKKASPSPVAASVKAAQQFVPAVETQAVETTDAASTTAPPMVNADGSAAFPVATTTAAPATSQPPKFMPVPNFSRYESTSESSSRMTNFVSALMKYFGKDSPNGPIPPEAFPADPNAFGPAINENYTSLNRQINGPMGGHVCSKNDTDRLTCMVCNIYFEARGETPKNQVAVGQTVMTRLFSQAWVKTSGPTTCDIIYAHSQYSWTEDKNSKQLPAGGAVLEQVIQSAHDALDAGPGKYTNYYAIGGMENHIPPSWATRPGTCRDTLTMRGTGPGETGNQQFCSIQATHNRPESEVLAAESRAEGVTVRSLASDGAAQ